MHGYTTHGHPCCKEAKPSQQQGLFTRCGGPRLCKHVCGRDADNLHAQSGEVVYESADSTPLAPEEIRAIEAEAEPHEPRRGDDVDAWLKAWRDRRDPGEECPEVDIVHDAIDAMLDDYRLRADYGLSLSVDLPEGVS